MEVPKIVHVPVEVVKEVPIGASSMSTARRQGREKEVIKEVPVEVVVVEKEVIREVEIIVEKPVEIIKHVPREVVRARRRGVVIREVPKERSRGGHQGGAGGGAGDRVQGGGEGGVARQVVRDPPRHAGSSRRSRSSARCRHRRPGQGRAGFKVSLRQGGRIGARGGRRGGGARGGKGSSTRIWCARCPSRSCARPSAPCPPAASTFETKTHVGSGAPAEGGRRRRPKEKKPQFNERCATEGSSRAAAPPPPPPVVAPVPVIVARDPRGPAARQACLSEGRFVFLRPPDPSRGHRALHAIDAPSRPQASSASSGRATPSPRTTTRFLI